MHFELRSKTADGKHFLKAKMTPKAAQAMMNGIPGHWRVYQAKGAIPSRAFETELDMTLTLPEREITLFIWEGDLFVEVWD